MREASCQFAAVELIHKIRLQSEAPRKPLFLMVAKKLLLSLKYTNFSGVWNKKCTEIFFHHMGFTDQKPGKSIEEEELFLCTVGLIWMLNSIRKTTCLKVSHKPDVCLKNRQYLAIEYDILDFLHLSEFHRMILELTSSSPNYGTNQEELCARLILSLISFDGMVIANADGRIADIEKKMIHLDCDMPLIEIPMSRKKGSQVKQFYLGNYSLGCMKILYQRAKDHGPIFPISWLMTDSHHKKRERRIYLETFLAKLWRSAFPDRPKPDYLDVEFWIRESRLSMVLNGVPFVCLADLRNLLRGAQVPVICVGDKLSHQSAQAEPKNVIYDVQCFDWLKSFHTLVRKHDNSNIKKMILGQAHELYDEIQKALLEAEYSGVCNEDEAVLARWLIWMMDQKRFRKMRLSTFRGYISAVSNRVLPLPEGKSIVKMGMEDWKQAVYDLATNEDYMPSSRRTAITHMKVLNEYLYEQGMAPKVNFSDYKYRVPRATAECEVIFPHEVDDIIDSLQDENMKIALILAFYCGLRCEEVCYLTVAGALDEYRLLVGRSKLASSRRTFPYGLFVPEPYMECLREIIQKRLDAGATWLVCGDGDEPMPTWKLSKQVGRLLSAKGARVQKMHGLRHGFSSWQFVRYFMLIDKQFREDVRVGRFHLEVDGGHPWFGDLMLANYAEVMGGASWCFSFERDGRCCGNATDMILISKLMGHASRFTTLESYTNTLGWVSHYYLKRREAKLVG